MCHRWSKERNIFTQPNTTWPQCSVTTVIQDHYTLGPDCSAPNCRGPNLPRTWCGNRKKSCQIGPWGQIVRVPTGPAKTVDSWVPVILFIGLMDGRPRADQSIGPWGPTAQGPICQNQCVWFQLFIYDAVVLSITLQYQGPMERCMNPEKIGNSIVYRNHKVYDG